MYNLVQNLYMLMCVLYESSLKMNNYNAIIVSQMSRYSTNSRQTPLKSTLG